MSKITKSNTKDEILVALAEAIEEQDLLHGEVESLNEKVEQLTTVAVERLESNLTLEALVQEEDIKKKNLIKEITSQAADVELAKKKTELYVEDMQKLTDVKKELKMVKGELISANKKVEVLTAELESFKNRALPTSKGLGRFFNFNKMVVAAIMVIITIGIVGAYIMIPDTIIKIISRIQNNGPVEIINPLAGMTFTETDGIVVARHEGGSALQTKDGVSFDESAIVKWAAKAGFDGVLFGTLTNRNGKVVLEHFGSGKYEFSEMDINLIASRFKELSCVNVLALVDNKENLNLHGIFGQTSQGNLEVFESRRMLSGFVPVFWGKEKKQMNVESDNIYAHTTSNEIFMEIKGIKAFTKLDTVKGTHSSH